MHPICTYTSLSVSVNGAYLHNYSTSDNIFHKGFDKLMVYEEVSIKTQNVYCKEGKLIKRREKYY